MMSEQPTTAPAPPHPADYDPEAAHRDTLRNWLATTRPGSTAGAPRTAPRDALARYHAAIEPPKAAQPQPAADGTIVVRTAEGNVHQAVDTRSVGNARRWLEIHGYPEEALRDFDRKANAHVEPDPLPVDDLP